VAVSVCQRFFDRRRADLEKKTKATKAVHVPGRPRCIICGRTSRFVNPYFDKRRHYP
jgi:hypothetical protein